MTFFKAAAAAVKTLIRYQAAYAAHHDPAAFAANKIALILAWNGPFYPLYVVLTIGRDALPWTLLTMLVSPFFYAVPWLSRRSSQAGRAALPSVGAANTVWCMKLFGADSGVGLFLFPCIILAALLFRPRERAVMLGALGLSLALLFLPRSTLGIPIMTVSPADAASLSALNAGSVACLLALIALQIANVARVVEKRL